MNKKKLFCVLGVLLYLWIVPAIIHGALGTDWPNSVFYSLIVHWGIVALLIALAALYILWDWLRDEL